MSSSATLTRVLGGIAGVGAVVAAIAIVAPSSSSAQVPVWPSPFALASGLDLECYDTPGPALNQAVGLSHLNPVLQQLGLPNHQVTVRELAQTCVPVMKNNVAPGPLGFLRHIDFACYKVDAAPLPNPVPLNLTHLNPVLAGLPAHNVALIRPQQLCVPVGKNGLLPPPAALQLVRYLDLECYALNAAPQPQFAVGLTQLNPQLDAIPPHGFTAAPTPRQLCVPVRKNQQNIPQGALDRIRWIDLERFEPAQPIAVPAQNVTLDHLNPLFVGLPAEHVVLQDVHSLLVPVAKNGAIPPQD